MEHTKQPKSFDAVKMMRDARDTISKETQGMNYAQLKKYIADKLKDAKKAKSSST